MPRSGRCMSQRSPPASPSSCSRSGGPAAKVCGSRLSSPRSGSSSAGSFCGARYAAINWAIAYVAPAFGLQALLLGLVGAAVAFTFDWRDIAARLGLLLTVIGLVAYPVLPTLFGRPWTSAEVFGIAPDPTAIVTLGILLAASGRFVPLLFPIPILWLLLSGLTLRTMGDPQAWIPLLAAGAGVAVPVMRRVVR